MNHQENVAAVSPEFVDQTREILTRWKPISPGQDDFRREYLAFVDELGPDAIDRYAGPEHLTASSFIFTADLSQVLLCFHRKGQFWVQLGGHIDPDDTSISGAAQREATEESGIVGLKLFSPIPVDMNRHPLPGAFGACRVHWDVGFGFIADRDAQIVVSAESEDVAWWPIDQLPKQTPGDFPDRLALALAELKHRLTDQGPVA